MVTDLPHIQEVWDEKKHGWSGPMSFYVARQRGALNPDLRVLLLIGKFGDPRRRVPGGSLAVDLDELAALSEGRLKVLAYADVAGFDDCSLEAIRLHAEHHDAPHRPDGRPLLWPHPRRLRG